MKKRTLVIVILFILFSLFIYHKETVEANNQSSVFLPFIRSPGNIQIIHIHAIGKNPGESDEYVEIQNNDISEIQLQNWTIRQSPQRNIFTFPNYVMKPGEICRIYTNETHPEWCGFNYGHKGEIWENSAGTAELRDAYGELIDWYRYIYGGLLPIQ